jgi:myeloid leukemia factor 1
MMQQMNSNPFALVNQMMGMNHMSGGGINGGMQVINSDPNSQIFSSSSVVSYSNTGDGKPKVYQESTQMRQGPGGVKETRKMVRDSEKGIEKIAVGHHIGDRAHVIERQKVRGEVEEIVNLENLDDEQVNEFNQEFESKITSQMRANHHHNNGHRSHHHQQHLGTNIPFAIEDSSSRHGKKDKERKSKSKPRN